ncbi:Bug family tripartite tricarboxylate transporter substrate binding protein [Muricoccus radiodurans]|uniref:Bug family tripartite tricarboxylate transporter substrate binding protein n=1 Tax=Muricoccus radiodurans TaxID=2231721 RepID=UPI003CED3085
MTHPLPRRALPRRTFLGTAGLLALPAIGRAQGDWPNRPVRYINPGPAGGAGDVLSRVLCERLTARLGQPFVVDNRPGAGTNIGMTIVARSAPDGYTMGLGSIASHAANRWLYRNLPFDPEKDFTAVSLIALVPNLMVVSPGLPVRTVAEFVEYAKARPGQINYGSVGAGSSQHLAGAQFGMVTGARMQHVPYNNSGQLNTDMIEGRVQVLFQSVSAIAEMARSGMMRPLAVTGTERQPAFPEVPTLREAGVDIVSTGWFGVVTPAGVPAPIIARLNEATVASLREPEVVARIVGLGSVPRPGTPEEFARHMAEESEKWRTVIQATGASAD